MMFLYKLIGRLPLFVLYTIATCMKWVFYYLISYRKKVISSNIQNAYPTLSKDEVDKLVFKFYGYLTDQLVEFFRGSQISQEEIIERVELIHEDIIIDYIKQGIPIVLVAGHQGNWEWAIHRLALTSFQNDIVYQKLSNPKFNEFTWNVRKRFGNTLLIEKRESVKISRDRKDIPRAVCLAADQSPSQPESAYWTTFLNQETGFFTGMERFAREYQYPVVFMELIRTQRGRYKMSFEELAKPNYEALAPGEIIERFARRLEKSINKYPDQYLWSHKRWKHQKPEKSTLKW